MKPLEHYARIVKALGLDPAEMQPADIYRIGGRVLQDGIFIVMRRNHNTTRQALEALPPADREALLLRVTR